MSLTSSPIPIRCRFAFVGTLLLALALLFTDNYYLISLFRSTSTATGQAEITAIDDRQGNIHGGVRGFSPLHLQDVHVAFGLSGNHSGFLAEFEVALKSVLLNAPLERSLRIHILADEEAFISLKEIFNHTELSTWQTRSPTEIHAYDVTSDHPQMENEIMDTYTPSYPHYTMAQGTKRHTMGAFYRLFVDRYVSTTAKHVLYMDTDVVIMANLEELWQLVERQPNAVIHWGKSICSGFVVMNVPRMKEILLLAKRSNFTNADGSKLNINADQTIYQAFNISYPNEVHVLPDGWDMTVSEIWQPKNRPYDKKFPNVGMLHFNGGGSSKEAYFGGKNGTEHSFMSDFKDTWGNGKYYATLPWEWARYQAKSLVREGSKGHSIEFFLEGKRRTRPF